MFLQKKLINKLKKYKKLLKIVVKNQCKNLKKSKELKIQMKKKCQTKLKKNS